MAQQRAPAPGHGRLGLCGSKSAQHYSPPRQQFLLGRVSIFTHVSSSSGLHTSKDKEGLVFLYLRHYPGCKCSTSWCFINRGEYLESCTLTAGARPASSSK